MENVIKCEGACEEHRGEVITVIVYGFGKPIKFNYCQTAIAEDQKRGFTVEPFDNTNTQTK